MRRHLLPLLLAGPALALGALAPGAVHADEYTFTGRIVSTFADSGIGGVQVVATAPLEAPAVVAVTSADGTWSFTSTTDEFELYFDGAPDYQSGWYDPCDPNAFYVVPVFNCTTGPGAVPTLHMFAAFATGRIVDSVSGLGVPGAMVEARQADGTTPIANAVTDAGGYYRIDGLATDEIALYVDGAPAGHTSGFFGCFAVVLTFPEACTFAPGPQPDRAVAPLTSVPRAVLAFSLLRGTITVFFLPPATGRPTGYELICTVASGATVVRTYNSPLQTRSGFTAGRNSCTFRALYPAGPGASTASFVVSVR